MTEFHNAAHAELAYNAIDRNRLMEGEYSETQEPAEFQHWIEVYDELASFKDRMLAIMRENLPSLPLVSAAEVRGIDMAIIQQQLGRYHERLAFWTQRAAEVGGKPKKSSPRAVSTKVLT